MSERNYYHDHRVLGGKLRTWWEKFDEDRMEITVWDDVEEEEIIETVVYETCPTCNGKGKHVSPSVDYDGLTAEDFYEDPDLADQYFGGHYDEPCAQCGGRRVVPVPRPHGRLEKYLRGFLAAIIDDAEAMSRGY